MTIDIVTIFPGMFDGPLGVGILRGAIERGLVDVRVHDLRAFTTDRHRVVDDAPFGGGPGMVMKPEPLFAAVEAIASESSVRPLVVLLSPQGTRFDQAEAVRLSQVSRLIMLCGRYEGVDERVRAHLVDEEISIGDYVLTGGELPALVVLDAVVRLLPGAVGNEASIEAESFSRGLLDHPQYTRPAEFRGWAAPAELLSGNHAEIRRWRAREAVQRTLDRRPELLSAASLNADEQDVLQALLAERNQGVRHERD